ncbi:hypothetical protein D3C85_1797850 [compost metagenome]
MRQREACRSELARESGVSSNINVDCDAVFASKLAPTVTVAMLAIEVRRCAYGDVDLPGRAI